jgi:hypothetical protein
MDGGWATVEPSLSSEVRSLVARSDIKTGGALLGRGAERLFDRASLWARCRQRRLRPTASGR